MYVFQCIVNLSFWLNVTCHPATYILCFHFRILLSIRETGGDWADGQHGRGDPILKGEKDPKAGPNIKIPERGVGPSSTQVTMCTF